MNGFATALLGVAMGLAADAQADIILPGALGNWGNYSSIDAVSGITGTYPRNGNGSIEMRIPATTAQARWWWDNPTPLPLAQFTGASYQYFRDRVSTNDAIQAPAYGLYVDNDCSWSTINDGAYLVYEPYYTKGGNVPTDTWVTESITPASVFWQSPAGAPGPSYLPLTEYIAGQAPADIVVSGDACIMGVTVLAGTGWSGEFRGAVDMVTLTVNGASVLSDNFELTATPSAAPVPVPTSSAGGVAAISALLGLAAAWRRRRCNTPARHGA